MKSKAQKRLQIALVALRKLATMSGSIGAAARIALKQCREIKDKQPKCESVTCYAMLTSDGRFIMADWNDAPSRVKCTITWPAPKPAVEHKED